MMIEVVNNEFLAEAGIYSIQVSAIDEAGNKGSASIDITVNGSSNPSSGDTVKPTLFINAPSSAYVGQEVMIGYDVSDNLTFSNEIVVEVNVSKNSEKMIVYVCAF